jgi:hypothetical protein
MSPWSRACSANVSANFSFLGNGAQDLVLDDEFHQEAAAANVAHEAGPQPAELRKTRLASPAPPAAAFDGGWPPVRRPQHRMVAERLGGAATPSGNRAEQLALAMTADSDIPP